MSTYRHFMLTRQNTRPGRIMYDSPPVNQLVETYYHKVSKQVFDRLPSVSSFSKLCVLNTYNAAGVSRRQDQNVTNFVTNINILEFGYYIWNPYEKCIQKSPNMPGIG